MSDEGKGFVAGCTILILLIIIGIFSDWYSFGDDRRLPRPERPAHPTCVYQPPGRC